MEIANQSVLSSLDKLDKMEVESILNMNWEDSSLCLNTPLDDDGSVSDSMHSINFYVDTQLPSSLDP